jgi:uncharacterized protein YigE (DUF2233 family)
LPRKTKFLLLLSIAALAVASAAYFLSRRGSAPPAAPVSRLPDICSEQIFEGAAYIVCAADSAKQEVRFSRLQPDGTPYRSLARLAETAKAAGQPLLFAMNAGMYHEDLSPVGLYVEEGNEQAKLQTGGGEGNFFLKPNGVFGIYSDGRPFVVTTEDYPLSQRIVSFATQSGPMLLIDGAIHPRFEPDGKSRFIRNGVGIDGQGRAVFVISLQPVSFGSFARLFRDALQCQNALYFDGVVSAFSNGESTLVGGTYQASPIVSVLNRRALVTQ